MEEHLTAVARNLRKLNSRAAADWIMSRYPAGSSDWGDAITVLPRISWKKADQMRLAHHYLSMLPFADARPYEAFASFMQIVRLIDVLREYIPSKDIDKKLLVYYVEYPLRNHAKTSEELNAVDIFLSELR